MIFGVVLQLTPFGRSLFVIGQNNDAAIYAGIRVKRVKLLLFVVSGIICSFAGILYTFRLSTAVQDNGLGLELNVVAIVLLGGVSIFGGRGSIIGVVLAVAVYASLQNALFLTSFPQRAFGIVTGCLLLVSVLAPNAGSFVRRGRAAWRRREARQPSGRGDQLTDATACLTRCETRQVQPAHGRSGGWMDEELMNGTSVGSRSYVGVFSIVERIQLMRKSMNRRSLVAVLLGAALIVSVPVAMAASTAAPLKKGLKVFVIPKNLGNPYFTTADSVKSGGALAALKALGEKGTETSGTAATAASQIPAIQAAITKGANALVVSASDAAALCPTLKSAMKKKIAVVTYDSDAPACRNIFINQADSGAIGRSQVDLLAKQIGKSGEIAILSAAASATNQNAWIGFMKQELKKYPNMKLVSTVYGNDDPTTSTQVAQGLLQQYPNLKGIISPTTVGIAAAAAVLDVAAVPGQGQADGSWYAELAPQVRARRHDRRVRALEPGRPRLSRRVRSGRTTPPARSPARRARRSRPASSARTRSARSRPSCSGRRTCSTRPTSASSTSRRAAGAPARRRPHDNP